jgi:hypothetical protein
LKKDIKKHSRQIPTDTLKSLLAKSGNQCAFPECKHPIFNDNNVFIAQLCHIEGVSPLGQRHNLDKNSVETNSYDNLLFLCYRHHKESDDVSLFSVQKLKAIKVEHEAKFKEKTYQFSNDIFDKLITETSNYWDSIEGLHINHIVPELAIPIDSKSNILTLIAEIDRNIKSLSTINDELIQIFNLSHFEYLRLAIPNSLARISVAINQIEIKYLEELVLKNQNSLELKAKLDSLRKAFEITAQSAGLLD